VRLVAAAGALVVFDIAAALLLILVAHALPRVGPAWPRLTIDALFYVAVNGLAIVTAYQIAFNGRRPDPARIGFGATRRVVSSVVLFVVGVVVLSPIAIAITRALGLGGTTSIDTTDKPLGRRLFVAVLAVLVAPWIEELAMRGMLFGALEARFGFWVGAVVSGFAWAGLHLVGGVLILFTVEGILLAWVRRRTGSILTGIGLHGAQNTLATALTGGGLAPIPIAGLLTVTLIAANRLRLRL
jgi:membrane protease YdiL (CAAX protease family)